MKVIWLLTGIAVSLIVLEGCGPSPGKDQDSGRVLSQTDSLLIEKANLFFDRLPEPADPGTPEALLGKKLYYEERLSASGEMSCNTCHPIDNYGVDNLPTSPGHDGTPGTRNSPTTLNAYFHTTQFWDGRSPDLADQAKGPVLNPIEMGLQSPEDVVNLLKEDETYREMFAAAFPKADDPVTFDNFAFAIEAFEKTLATPAAFDRFLQGAVSELSDIQKEGLALFIETGCIACHSGPGLGGNTMQRFGLVHGPYWEHTGSELKDKGKAEVTGKKSDEMIFKSPSLRNVEKTAPYFHDGSVESLHRAVKIMGYTQLGRELSDEETDKMVAFFRSLTGNIPEYAL